MINQDLPEILWGFAAFYAIFLLLLIRRPDGFGVVTFDDLIGRLDKIARFVAAFYIAAGLIWAIFVLPIKALTGTIPTLSSLIFMLLAITAGYIANKVIFHHPMLVYIFAIGTTIFAWLLVVHNQGELKELLRSSFL